jgi:signal transduction histidine kinase
MNGAGTITVRAYPNHSGVICEVSDTGPGIAAENIDKIFEPLFTTKARGIGLGLAVSRTLARANGGELSVESVPGKGATFRLTLADAGVPAPGGMAPDTRAALV